MDYYRFKDALAMAKYELKNDIIEKVQDGIPEVEVITTTCPCVSLPFRVLKEFHCEFDPTFYDLKAQKNKIIDLIDDNQRTLLSAISLLKRIVTFKEFDDGEKCNPIIVDSLIEILNNSDISIEC